MDDEMVYPHVRNTSISAQDVNMTFNALISPSRFDDLVSSFNCKNAAFINKKWDVNRFLNSWKWWWTFQLREIMLCNLEQLLKLNGKMFLLEKNKRIDFLSWEEETIHLESIASNFQQVRYQPIAYSACSKFTTRKVSPLESLEPTDTRSKATHVLLVKIYCLVLFFLFWTV